MHGHKIDNGNFISENYLRLSQKVIVPVLDLNFKIIYGIKMITTLSIEQRNKGNS